MSGTGGFCPSVPPIAIMGVCMEWWLRLTEDNRLKNGFSLVEIILVILIIAIIATVGIPRVLRSPLSQTEQFMGNLNSLVRDAVDSAQQTGSTKRVFFNFSGKKVSIQSVGGKQEGRSIDIPDAVEVSDALINGRSAFSLGAGEKRDLYFLINSEGISQEVRLMLIDHNIRARSPRGGAFEFYLNPFTAVFRLR